MWRSRFSTLTPSVLAILLVTAAPTLADPIAAVLPITGGNASFETLNDRDLVLNMTGLDFVGDIRVPESLPEPLFLPIAATVDPSFSISSDIAFGTLRVGNRVFTFGLGLLEMQMDITAEPQPLPALPPFDELGVVSVAYPFTLMAFLVGQSDDGTALAFHFVGQGTGTTSFGSGGELAGPGFIHNLGGSLSFEPSAPVPEPASLLLVGAGICGIARTIWRKHPQVNGSA